MKSSINYFILLTLMVLTACSTQKTKQDTASPPPPKESSAPANDELQSAGPNPPMTRMKGKKKLNLVRVMDGGACKNDLQGVKGAFLLYAYSADIERIKSKRGPQIFSDFETKIQALSTEALQQAIKATNLDENPFALDEDEAQQKLAVQLSENFRDAVAEPIKAFEKETTLTIDIEAFLPSFIFYQKGCEAIQPDDSNDTDD